MIYLNERKQILIINPPFYRLQGESLVHYPPGCCYVAGALKKAGIKSRIYNADYDPKKKTLLGNTNHINIKGLLDHSNDYKKQLESESGPVWDEIRQNLAHYKPDILIISVFTTTLTAGNKIARMAKSFNPAVQVIFEGCFNRGLHCAVDPAKHGDFEVMDFAISDEPEAAIVELIEVLLAGKDDFADIKGISWRDGSGNIVHNDSRPRLQNLDELPFPARHALLGSEKMPPHCFQGIYGSRGCPYDCVFCGCHVSMGYKPRTRSAENMVTEIEHVHKTFGTRYFYICDDIFFIDKQRARTFCELLIKKKLPVFFSAQTRAELVDNETLRLVKKAGGQHIAVGVEVGNPEIRELIHKGNTIDDVRNCAKLIRSNGLRMVAFTMVGLPWEGEREIKQTVALIKEIKPYIVYAYMPTPGAGTELRQLVSEKNPAGLNSFHDSCHIDTSSGFSEKMSLEERRKVLEWAMNEFVQINRKNLLKDIITRPRFYWALANDMGLLKNPRYLLSYLIDFLH